MSIEWDRVDQATTTTTTPPTTTIVNRRRTPVRKTLEAIIDRWLADLGPDAVARREVLSIDGSVIRLDASGTVDAPSLASLTEMLDAGLGQTLEVQMTWLKRQNGVRTGADTDTRRGHRRQNQPTGGLAWAKTATQQITVLSTTFDGDKKRSSKSPDRSRTRCNQSLLDELATLLEPDDRVTVLFVERLDITTTTTPTSTTTIPS